MLLITVEVYLVGHVQRHRFFSFSFSRSLLKVNVNILDDNENFEHYYSSLFSFLFNIAVNLTEC
jgi:hypothetical protein